MSQNSNRPPPTLFAIGGEIARSMVTLHMRGASQFVQTQVAFLSGMQSASAPDDTRRVQRQYVEAMCDGAQQHAEGLMAVFANIGGSQEEPDEQFTQQSNPAPVSQPPETEESVATPAEVSAPNPAASAISDDLTQVSGIGRVFATKLAALGITRFADLANLDLTALENENHPLHDYRARVVSDEWIEQATNLAG